MDYAAASLILKEVGRVITQIDGKAITLDAPCPILAGNSKCHEETLQLLEQVVEEIDQTQRYRIPSGRS